MPKMQENFMATFEAAEAPLWPGSVVPVQADFCGRAHVRAFLHDCEHVLRRMAQSCSFLLALAFRPQ